MLNVTVQLEKNYVWLVWKSCRRKPPLAEKNMAAQLWFAKLINIMAENENNHGFVMAKSRLNRTKIL